MNPGKRATDGGAGPHGGEGNAAVNVADGRANDVREALRTFWNARYAADDFVYGTAPNEFLVEVAPRFAARGRVLCLADGEGRNGVWLAERGHVVTAVDVADLGMAKAARLAATRGVNLETIVADVTRYDPGRGCFDSVVSIFLHLPGRARRALHRRCLDALKPGGLFAYTAYGPEQLGRGTGGPPDPKLLHALDDVAEDFAGCAIEHRMSGLRDVREGKLHGGIGAVVELLARKPE